MSASNSQSSSETKNYSEQKSSATYGGSGSGATVSADSSNINLYDAGGQVSINALNQMAAVVNKALSAGTSTVGAVLDQQSNLQGNELGLLSDQLGKQADADAAATEQSNQLLSSVLQNNADLAANVQSGGAASAQKTTNYVIFGLIALGALFVFMRK